MTASTMKKLSELTDVVFDGVNKPYVPGKTLKISDGLKLHTEQAADIDPITYEVIRHNLWHINEEHGATIQRISGSPVAIYAIDLNPSILTEDAEFVFFGPFMQYMSGVTDTQVKWILEYRSDNPGIEDGDMFLANDPWVGAAHQSDVMLICPVFHDGELFCWITNCLHQYDIGGTTPSSFCTQARDVFDEGIVIPPVKIVEKGTLRKDIEAIYLRSSRRPDMVALDLRAQMAGNVAAVNRVRKLIERYGAATVKGVMKKIIANAEASFLKKMETLPDGAWSERTYVECAYPGDRNIYQVMTTVRKEGTELIFENHGTAGQIGGMNATYSGWRGSAMVVLNHLLAWDQYFAVGGALRHVRFDPTPGTFTCADYPASVSTAPIQAMEIALYPVYNVLAKMMYSNPDLRPDILCMSGASQFVTLLYSGLDQYGDYYGYGCMDPLGGAIGAFPVGDGISTGGQSRTPFSKIPNIEFTEYQFPLLYLYRKERADSGGAGRFRGGLGGESCWVTHNSDRINHEPIGSGAALPSSLGMMGGYPAGTNKFGYVGNSDIRARFSNSDLPGDIEDVKGKPYTMQLRDTGVIQTPDDVISVAWCGGGGFGDPARRDPDLIDRDLEDRVVTPDGAERQYTVVIDRKSLTVDRDATERLRETVRQDRLKALGAKPVKRSGTKMLEATPTIHVFRDNAGPYFGCADCGTSLGNIGENYKLHALREDTPIEDANPMNFDPKTYVDEEVVFRKFYCHGCGGLLDTEVAVGGAEPILDFVLQLPDAAE